MVTIIASIKPRHLDNIRAGRKDCEVRRTMPRAGLPFRVLCCESGSGGQIKAEFVVREVITGREPAEHPEKYAKMACLTVEEMKGYIRAGRTCLWVISDMVDYCSAKGHRVRNVSEFGLTRAPESWQYAKGER